MSEKRKRDEMKDDILPSCVSGRTPVENHKRRVIEKFSIESNKEEDDHRIEQRLKQIKFGKNTIGYDRYIADVPKHLRKGYSEHPRTPDPYEKVPKRTFDGRIKAWRRLLHHWDPADTVSLVEKDRDETKCNKIEESIPQDLTQNDSIKSIENFQLEEREDDDDDVL